jgi:mRNA interferase RelE/StbE
MSWSIRIKQSALKDLKRIDKTHRLRVVSAIEALRENPYRGSALKGDLRGLRRIRVGDFRVIYEIQNEKTLVLVIAAGHRREIYRS